MNKSEKQDLESLVTPGAKNAYKALIEGSSSNKEPPTSQPSSPANPNSPNPNPVNVASEPLPSSNALPLPPKSQKLTLSQPPKRHVRKNPLIIPSGMAANVLSRRATDQELANNAESQPEQFDLKVSFQVFTFNIGPYTNFIWFLPELPINLNVVLLVII